MTATLDHVSFQILLKQHNGNRAMAEQAWRAICQLGGFGNVPTSYQGGLDVKGINIARDEFDQGEEPFLRVDAPTGDPISFEPPTLDDLRRIEDYASGDKPKIKEI